MKRIDQTDIEIIRQLRDGRKSFKIIADKLGLSENTVRSRVNKLREEESLDIIGIIDPQAINGHTAIIVGIKLSSMDLVKKAEEFSKVKGVVFSSVVTGRYDLILLVLLNQDFSLLEFYTEEASRISGIQSVESFVVYKGYNMKVPYLL